MIGRTRLGFPLCLCPRGLRPAGTLLGRRAGGFEAAEATVKMVSTGQLFGTGMGSVKRRGKRLKKGAHSKIPLPARRAGAGIQRPRPEQVSRSPGAVTSCFHSPHSYEHGWVPSEALAEFGVGSQSFRTGLFLPGLACSLLIPVPALPRSLEFS